MSNDNNSNKDDGFDSDRFLRRLERERRLKEIEQTFQNIAEEAKQKQQDIYSNVFTEQGQAETLANHNNIEMKTVPLNEYVPKSEKNMLSRVSEFVAPHRHPSPQGFEISPTGVASFPEIGPIGVAHNKHRNLWQNDGPGFGARLSNARVQDNIFKSFFAVRSNSKKLILGVLLFCLVVTLLVTLIDLSEGQAIEVSEEAWEKLEIIRPKLISQNVERKRLYDSRSVYFKSLAWLSDEATQIPIPGSHELLERYVMGVFFYSTEGESWTNKVNWLRHGIHICDWHGVTCTIGTSKTVKKIALHNNNLKGTVTDEIAKLEDLNELILSENKLNGEVPSSLGDLISLRTLNLGENDLIGYMPDNICDLKDENLSILISDCGGQDKDIDCDCCTECSP